LLLVAPGVWGANGRRVLYVAVLATVARTATRAARPALAAEAPVKSPRSTCLPTPGGEVVPNETEL